MKVIHVDALQNHQLPAKKTLENYGDIEVRSGQLVTWIHEMSRHEYAQAVHSSTSSQLKPLMWLETLLSAPANRKDISLRWLCVKFLLLRNQPFAGMHGLLSVAAGDCKWVSFRIEIFFTLCFVYSVSEATVENTIKV